MIRMALVLMALCAAAQAGSAADIEAIERARFDALTRQDLAAVEKMLAEDLVYCHSNGECDSKASLLQSIRSGARVYRKMDVLEMKPRLLGDTAIINGTLAVKVETNGRPLEFRLAYTDVYVQRDGRWLLTAWQSTRLP